MSCRSIRALLHVESSALGEADRLLLEDHLQSCERCRADRERLALVHHIGASLPAASIGPRGHGRAIARALMEGVREPARARSGTRWWALAATAAATAAAAIAVLLVIRSGGADDATSGLAAPSEPPPLPVPRAPEPGPPRSPPAAPDVALVEGTLLRGGAALPVRGELPSDVALRATTLARVLVYGTSVVIAASSQVRWTATERTLVLEAGTVQIDGGPSRIATGRFRVDVSGAATITDRTVSVQRGSARITGAGGSVLVPRLEAGASWTVPEPPAAVVKPNAARLLVQAREAFAKRDHAGAERHADAALDAGPTRVQAAEARTILAECAHATSRLDDALSRYEAIASRFGDLPAGETALFAAARLQASRGLTHAARALFEQYLDRYPSGRFAGDARRHTRAPR